MTKLYTYSQQMQQMRRKIIEISAEAKEGHIPSALSILDIVWVIYDQILSSKKDDRFILSKGHGSLALYVVLENKGFISQKDLEQYCTVNGILGGHPDRTKVSGVEASTGSLGHGFPIAIGLALSQKILEIDSRVFVLIGDGEANEGTTWESALLASHHKLSNLTCIIDHNHSTDRALKIDSVKDKFLAFGWNVIEVFGHYQDQIKEALESFDELKPTLIVAETIKGFGVKGMENNPAWHHKFPTKEEAKIMIEGLT